MTFVSYVFILAYMPITIFSYYVLRRYSLSASKVFMLVASCIFIGWLNWKYALFICVDVLFTYWCSRIIITTVDKKRRKKVLFIISVCIQICLLLYCKYLNFFIETMNLVFRTDYNMIHLFIPLGISYYTFTQIAYLTDIYRGKIEKADILDYGTFVLWYPKIVQGPICYYQEFVNQINNQEKCVDYCRLTRGLQLFSIGLLKKTLLADTFAKAVNWGYSAGSLTSTETIVVSLAYTFQLYFDFSGYSDMAIGVSKMFGIDLISNFESPYKAFSIPEFWGRWHISLTRFLRDYIYIPLGGNRKGKIRTYINNMIVFLVSGLWHGANITFVVWGLCHGIACCCTKACSKAWERMHSVVRWFLTFSFVNILWVVFRANNLAQAIEFIKKIISFSGGGISEELKQAFVLTEYTLFEQNVILNAIYAQIVGQEWLVLMAIAFLICLNGKTSLEKANRIDAWTMIRTAIYLVWGIVSMASVVQFIYAGF